MREIKFRAWDTESKAMDAWEDILASESLGWYFNSDSIIMLQYTNLKDKNGTEIYEGGILFPGKRLVLLGEYFGPFGMGTGFYTISYRDESDGLPYGLASRQIDNSEVIGNIHENPELLK